jgi:hypothetical protein
MDTHIGAYVQSGFPFLCCYVGLWDLCTAHHDRGKGHYGARVDNGGESTLYIAMGPVCPAMGCLLGYLMNWACQVLLQLSFLPV